MRPIGLPDFLYRTLGKITKFNHKIVTLIKDWFQQLAHRWAAESNRTCTMRQLETPGATRNTVWSQDVPQALRRFNPEHQWEIFPHLCDPPSIKRRASGRISKYCGRQHHTLIKRELIQAHCLPQLFGSMIAYRPAKQ